MSQNRSFPGPTQSRKGCVLSLMQATRRWKAWNRLGPYLFFRRIWYRHLAENSKPASHLKILLPGIWRCYVLLFESHSLLLNSSTRFSSFILDGPETQYFHQSKCAKLCMKILRKRQINYKSINHVHPSKIKHLFTKMIQCFYQIPNNSKPMRWRDIILIRKGWKLGWTSEMYVLLLERVPK